MASRNKSKKVVSKDELRKLMKKKEAEVKSTTRKKVDHPLAIYNSLGQLVCSLCNCVVKNELLWKTHLQSKQHKERVSALKSRALGPERPEETSLKRKIVDPAIGIINKKSKGNSGRHNSSIPSDFFDSSPSKKSDQKPALGLAAYSSSDESSGEEEESGTKGNNSSLPPDFFDPGEASSSKDPQKPVPKVMAESLPEGFFDDPKMDAKVRQVEYRDKMDDEWEKFQKVMKEENTVSEAIVEEEEEQATVDRNIDEIDEQMQKWKEVNDLQVKKEELMTKKTEVDVADKGSDDESDEDVGDQEFEEFLDWRTKKKPAETMWASPDKALQTTLTIEKEMMTMIKDLTKHAMEHSDAHLMAFLEQNMASPQADYIFEAASYITKYQKGGAKFGLSAMNMQMIKKYKEFKDCESDAEKYKWNY
ncbi:zinc finger protein 830-like [Liolophura sinensis]|uniref:zinc finger protein 830-like n=1 Tax=Liolophura sinensis TaxID=3198878 RepID=UPI0031582B34